VKGRWLFVGQHFVAEILGPDMLVILALVALLFGGTQIPKLARSLGSAKKEFELGQNELSTARPQVEPEVDHSRS
jgi:sec-independent protein translocase protein TatA